MKRTYLYRACGLVFVAAVLAGCGGGGGGGGGGYTGVGIGVPPVATTPAPVADDSFTAYVKDLITKVLDMAEPADVTAFDPPPTSETREPSSTQ